MTRDPGLEEELTEDFGNPDAPTGKAMLGGWCFMLNGNMLGAARDGLAMFRLGKDAQTDALALPGSSPWRKAGGRNPASSGFPDPRLLTMPSAGVLPGWRAASIPLFRPRMPEC